MLDKKERPSHKAFVVEKFSKEGTDKSHWIEVGAAWPHKDGKGFDLNLKALPVDGRIVLREGA